MSPTTRRNIYRIIPFGIIWLLFSIVYTLLEKGILADLHFYPATGNPYNFSQNIFITPFTALITGLLMGVIEILYLNKLFIQKSFTKKIIYKSLIYLLIIIVFNLLLSAITNATELHAGFFTKKVWLNVLAFATDYSFVSVTIYISAGILITQFYNEVSDNIGHEVLQNFFTGKYHKAAVEERIFMFLDMKSSTTIAEKLGHVKYFELLQEYYADISAPVIQHSGEIYQYVGDEMIVSWTMDKGLRDNNCLECFYSIRETINKQTEKYQSLFSIVPEFKAGFHYGKVTTGEIGVIKKEIIFTGDVLNTTARIQGLCNQYNVGVLLSADLFDKLSDKADFIFTSIGENELRGKGERLELFTIIRNK
ncbi:MAG: adenylate/guanylate cyclase domain-containing protein [Chitinophagaceae bacterium]